MLFKILSVFLGGGLGATLRFITTEYSKKIFGLTFIGTFIVNIFGCLLIGYVAGIVMNKVVIPDNMKLFITMGFIGGLTTFSTFNIEVFNFLKSGKIVQGIGYMLVSIIIGLCVTAFGYFLSQYQLKI